MPSATALLIAAVLVILALLAVMGVAVYFGFRFLTTVAVLKAAPDAKAAAAMLRAATGEKAKEPEKLPMEMPATGIEDLAGNPEAIKNLRKRQDPSPEIY